MDACRGTLCGNPGMRFCEIKDHLPPCDTSEEFISVVCENKLRALDNFKNTECLGPNNTAEYSQQLEMFDNASEYLCHNSIVDGVDWSRSHYGQLIAAGCMVTKMAYNCHCHGNYPHKNILRDLMTIKATQANFTMRLQECDK